MNLLRRIADYWRERQIRRWVNKAYPLDTDYHRTMRHDLVHGSDQCK